MCVSLPFLTLSRGDVVRSNAYPRQGILNAVRIGFLGIICGLTQNHIGGDFLAINCTSPSSLFVWTDVNGDRQTKLLPYGTDHYTTPDGSLLSSPYLVPCGRCLPCKKSKAAEWSNRLVCIHIFLKHIKVSFLICLRCQLKLSIVITCFTYL